MMKPTLWLFCLTGFVMAQSNVAPKLTQLDDGLRLQLSADVLDNPTVQRHLASGLTTTFRIEVQIKGNQKKPQTWVMAMALRYELWEEVYLLELVDGDSALQKHVLKDVSGLRSWWQTSQLMVTSHKIPAKINYRITVEVIPFSAQERDAATAWVNQSLRVERQGSNVEEGGIGARILGTIVATSFKRKVLQTFTYKGQWP